MDTEQSLRSVGDLKGLINEKINDPRVEGRTTHPLVNVLVIGLATILCGGESFPDMVRFAQSKKDFFAKHLDLSGGIPSHDTFERVFESLDPKELSGLLMLWVMPGALKGQVAIDGKAVRASKRKGQRALHLVNAYAKECGLALAQYAVEDKSNEITALPLLIRSLDLEGCVVSIDAAGCQRNIAKEIHEADADYVLALKGNQGNAHEEIASYFRDAIDRGQLEGCEQADKGHGRIEVRRIYQSDQLDWFADCGKWENLHSIIAVESYRENSEATSCSRQWRYYLSSLPVDLERTGELIRGHWSVENNLHWVLDVTFGEDRSQKSHKIAAQNLALMRKLALNIIKADATKDAIKGKRLRAGWNNDYLAKLLGFDA